MTRKLYISSLIICALIACQSPAPSEEVLFVCTHGAARSPIAAAYFNKLAQDNDLNYHAVFRGTQPDQQLTKETIEGLVSDGFSIDDWLPQEVSIQDVDKASKIVTFDCTVPTVQSKNMTIEWNGTPSISEDYNAARDVIKENVEQLIEQLKQE